MIVSCDMMKIINNEVDILNGISEDNPVILKSIKDGYLSEKTYLKSALDGIIKACETIKKDNGVY